MNRYAWCVRIASTYDSRFRYDIVHDCWLRHYLKTGTDLFVVSLQEEKTYLYTQIKYAFYAWYYRERKGYNAYTGVKYVYSSSEDLLDTRDTFEEVSANYTLNQYRKKYVETLGIANSKRTVESTTKAINVFDLHVQGFDGVSIGNQLGMSKQHVNFYVRQIKRLSKK